MEALILEWLNLLLRWLHLITGIAWIGASFYFVWLDNSLETPPDWKKDKGISGDLWAFHGGGIYEVAKYSLAPEKMPTTLHWFKWEAYSTWITGALLMVVFYYVQADLYLVSAHPWADTAVKSIAASLLFLAAGLGVYEILMRSPLREQTAVFASVLCAYIAFSCWLATEIFSDRAAFLHVGAMLATIMAANVLFGIIPAQKKFMAAIDAGRTPDKAPMLIAKNRSVYNNYFTLPVLFCMISNHYAFLYGHTYNWLILIVIVATTAYARHFFNLRHRGIIKPRILLISLGVLLAMISFMVVELRARQAEAQAAAVPPAGDKELLVLLQTHCTLCHAQTPTQAGFSAAPAGLVLENIEQLTQARDKAVNAMETRYMPLANMTQMTDEERRRFIQLTRALREG